MSVTVNKWKKSGNANGVAPIPFDFQAISADEIAVTRAGVLQVKDVDFTVVLNGDNTGSITPLASWGVDPVVIYSKPTFLQLAAFTRFGAFYPDQFNPPLDRLAKTDQAIAGQVDDANLRVDDVELNIDAVIASVASLGSTISSPMRLALFAAAALVSIPLGTDAVETGGYSTAGKGAASYVYDAAVDAAYVAANPRISFVSANGRGFRLSFSQMLDIFQFGATANDPGAGAFGTDDYPAFAAAFAFLQTYTIPAYINPALYRGGFTLRVPRGGYYISQSLAPLFTGKVIGDGGLGWGAPTRIRCAAGIDGVQMQAYNTSGKAVFDGVTHFSGDAFQWHDIAFIGAYNGVESDSHGARLKRLTCFYNCTFDGFEGDGIYARTTFGSGVGATEGNTNVARLFNCHFDNNRSGMSFQFADANAITHIGCSFTNNRRWAIEDRSFLGNHGFGHHFDGSARTANNDGTANKPCSFVSYGGNRYLVIEGQEAGASVNAPTGTTAGNTWWAYWQAGGVSAATGIPAWVNGINVRSGGHVLINGLNNSSTIGGSHGEINAPSQLDQLGFIDGGTMSDLYFVSGGACLGNRTRNWRAANGGLTCDGIVVAMGGLNVNGPQITLGPYVGTTIADGVTVLASRNASHVLQAQLFDSGGNPSAVYASFGFYNGLGTILDTAGARTHRVRIGGADVHETSSVGLDIKTGKVLSNNGVTIINGAGVLQQAATPAYIGDVTKPANSLTLTLGANVVAFSKFVAATAKGLVGASAAGNFQQLGLANGLDVSGGNLILSAATPASVAATGSITSSGGGIGYATGAGGTVAQATSKATGVTLNKLCGEITLNGAALAASTTVSFVLTNSQIAAGDNIILQHATTGTFGSYTLNAHGFAAGSCTIDVRNVSLGSLSEAIVIRFTVVKSVTA